MTKKIIMAQQPFKIVENQQKKMPKKFLILLIKKITNLLKGQKTITNCLDQ